MTLQPIASNRSVTSGRWYTSWGMPEWFMISQVAGPALLYLPGTQVFRLPLRMGVFGVSLLGLTLWLRNPKVATRHPSWPLLAVAAAYMGLMIFHPNTNTVMAGLGQTTMHLAVAAPLLWAPHYFIGDFGRLARILTILWILNGASTVVGIMQVIDPNRWMPAEYSSVFTGKGGISHLGYRAAGGNDIIRPPGLGDSPGAACGAGLFVASAGLAFLGLPVSNTRKVFGVAGCFAGISVIFLSHVRSLMVVLIGCCSVYILIMFIQKRVLATLIVGSLMAACVVGSLQFASSLGGKSTVDRFATLVEDNPLAVYEKSQRLGMVSNTFDTLIYEYPFGAGLARCGMMRHYFGDSNNPNSPVIWAEVQFPQWVLDGGVVLLFLYLSALIMAVARLFRLGARHRSAEQRQWAAVIIMLSAPPIALMFNFTPFYAQIGSQFWFLIGAFEGATQGQANSIGTERLGGMRWARTG